MGTTPLIVMKACFQQNRNSSKFRICGFVDIVLATVLLSISIQGQRLDDYGKS